MPEPLIINSELNELKLFNLGRRVADAGGHARRLLSPRLGFTDAVDKFQGTNGLSNMERLCSLALAEEIGMAVLANDPYGHEAGLVVAEKNVIACSEQSVKCGIFITAWFVGKEDYTEELTALFNTGVDLARLLESGLNNDEEHDGIFVLERVQIEDEQAEKKKSMVSRFKDKAVTLIDVPTDNTALETVHKTVGATGLFVPIGESLWSRTRAISVIQKDGNGKKQRNNRGEYVLGLEQVASNPHQSVLYVLNDIDKQAGTL